MHINRGMPLTSAEQEPHFPGLQFHLTARSLAGCPGPVDDVEHDLALFSGDDVILQLAAVPPPPDAKCQSSSMDVLQQFGDLGGGLEQRLALDRYTAPVGSLCAASPR